MTDRASAEVLRRYRAIINANGAMEFIEDPDGALVTYADVAALRDTGPRPDNGTGLRERIESLIDDDEAAYVSVALIRAALRDTGPRPDSGISRSVIRRQNVMAGREMNKGIAGPRPDGEGPWRDDQGYWLGGMGTPDTGPRPDSDSGDIDVGRVRVLGLSIEEIRRAVATADMYYPQWRASTPRTETSE